MEFGRFTLCLLWETCYRMEQALHFTLAKTPWEYWLAAERLAWRYKAENYDNT